VTKTEYAAEV